MSSAASEAVKHQWKFVESNTSHRGAIRATMPVQVESALARRDREKAKHVPALPPNVLVDAMYFPGSADPKQKPLLRHVIVKDLNKVADRLKLEHPTTGVFENLAPMGLYAVFDGMSGAGEVGPLAAEFCARNFHTKLLTAFAELTAIGSSAQNVQAAIVRSFEDLDRDLLENNPEITDGCGAAVALLVGQLLFTATLGRCTAVLCEVVKGKPTAIALGGSKARMPQLAMAMANLRSLGDRSRKFALGPAFGKAFATCIADVQINQLSGYEVHPYIILTTSTATASLNMDDILSIAGGYQMQPRATCGELTTRGSGKAAVPCTAVQVCFLPTDEERKKALGADASQPPAKKAKTMTTTAMSSYRLRHILMKFHDGPKPIDEAHAKAKWAKRTRIEAEALLRRAIADLRKDREELKKTPKDLTELVAMTSKKFMELARELSDCDTAQKGGISCGDLGWVTQEARLAMGENFKEVIDILQPGQWSDIVLSNQGVHLVQRIA